MKKRKCAIRVAKTKVLISFAVTAKLICVFVFAYADCWFSHEAALLSVQDILFLKGRLVASYWLNVEFEWRGVRIKLGCHVVSLSKIQ